MQTATTGYDLVLDPTAYEGVHLIESDGIPMDSNWHFLCLALLIDITYSHYRDREDYWVGGNNFIYFNPDQARNLDYRGPDYYFIKDGVDRTRNRQYWAVWLENGRRPDVIIELLSPTTEREDRTTKFTIYEQTLQTPEYFLYSPDTERLEGWRLIGGSYVPLQLNEQGWLWSEELGLWLGTWDGETRGIRGTWLRMYTASGELVLAPVEAAEQLADQVQQRADQEQQRADQERQLADQERRRADKAEEELKRLRVLLQQQTPPKPNGPQS